VPQLIITAGAIVGLERCRRFLANRNPLAAKRASDAIERQFRLLETHPEIGRPDWDEPELRELLITFGDSGYAVLYRFSPADDTVYILAFRHQTEAGW
jgi:plasmid stabilization system protein ParE